ncbi:reverse transcriptase [Phytophthora megakarya]|uniref:Reverse transcriptase n=1 Tax=Phytophthora megakarya TaxID=4795 RepID=A0A225VCT8_9STRA|nr:reverse transcriptase [Phytophthora megakarya]
MWFMSLDMSNCFWAVKMSERAKLISAFVCPFGHFQWTRVPFGLKNAPLIYQSVINNCLWGFVRLPPEEEITKNLIVAAKITREETHGFHDRFRKEYYHAFTHWPGSSYIDDIAHGAKTWDQLCEDVDTLLYRLRYWNISSQFGKRSIFYLSHEISAEGIRATPIVEKGTVPQIPQRCAIVSRKSNYYHKFIEDFPVVQQFSMNFQKTRYVRDGMSHELMNLSN